MGLPNFSRTNFSKANFSRANVSEANFFRADAVGSAMACRATAHGRCFWGAYLQRLTAVAGFYLGALHGRRQSLAVAALSMAAWIPATAAQAATSPAPAPAQIQAQASVHISPKAIQQQTVSFLTGHYQHLGRLEVSVGNLDRRLRLQTCGRPLAFSARDTSGLGGNVSVQVRCADQPGWSIHLPAQVSAFREIPVAARDLVRGEQLTAGDIHWQVTNISQLRQSYLPDPSEIIGREVKRNIGQGAPFINTALDSPRVIRRGDSVLLESTAGGIRVLANGTAMSDGRLGQAIRAKNNQSDRIVSGTVIAEGRISIF